MAALHPVTRELVFKIVFFGPGLGGKTTTLRFIHGATKPEHRGSMVTLATDDERTLYFDFVPIQALRLRDMSVRLQLFTVPGQVYYGATRKLVLTGADGVVFVADSQTARLEANLESLEDLAANLREHGKNLSEVPHTFQWNKRDLPACVSAAELDRRLNLFNAPSLSTVATRGEGVFEGLEVITKLVFNAYTADLPAESSQPRGPIFVDAEDAGLTDALRGLADSQPAARGPASGGAKPSGPATVNLPLLSPTASPASGTYFTLRDLFLDDDREAAARCETLLGTGEATSAVVACDVLLTRMLAQAHVALGIDGAPQPAALVTMVLGPAAPRYLRFRAVVQAAKRREDVTQADALEAYLFTVECRLALGRAARGAPRG